MDTNLIRALLAVVFSALDLVNETDTDVRDLLVGIREELRCCPQCTVWYDEDPFSEDSVRRHIEDAMTTCHRGIWANGYGRRKDFAALVAALLAVKAAL